MASIIPALRYFYYGFLIRPLLLIILGLNVRHLERLEAGPGRLIAANHNSHLDAMVLMSLFRMKDLPKVKVVAARDYFCRTKLREWLSMNIIGIIPIDRDKSADDPLAPVLGAIDGGYTVIMFPEGSRGEPEERQKLKYGIAKLLELRPHITITPVFMYGLGKSLPRGDALLVPFVCEINIGEAFGWNGERQAVIDSLDNAYTALAEEIQPRPWP